MLLMVLPRLTLDAADMLLPRLSSPESATRDEALLTLLVCGAC